MAGQVARVCAAAAGPAARAEWFRRGRGELPQAALQCAGGCGLFLARKRKEVHRSRGRKKANRGSSLSPSCHLFEARQTGGETTFLPNSPTPPAGSAGQDSPSSGSPPQTSVYVALPDLDVESSRGQYKYPRADRAHARMLSPQHTRPPRTRAPSHGHNEAHTISGATGAALRPGCPRLAPRVSPLPHPSPRPTPPPTPHDTNHESRVTTTHSRSRTRATSTQGRLCRGSIRPLVVRSSRAASSIIRPPPPRPPRSSSSSSICNHNICRIPSARRAAAAAAHSIPSFRSSSSSSSSCHASHHAPTPISPKRPTVSLASLRSFCAFFIW